MVGNLYFVSSKPVEQALRETRQAFIDKHGYAPTKVMVNTEERQRYAAAAPSFGLTLMDSTKDDQVLPHHVMLYEVIKGRTPRVFKGTRSPVS